MSTLNDLIELIPQISSGTRYWFVRTESGMLYEAFIGSQSIALGYSKISLDDIAAIYAKVAVAKAAAATEELVVSEAEKGKKKKAKGEKKEKEDTVNERIKKLVATRYPERKSPGFVASQLVTLTQEIKKGDYVIIPSVGTEKITIGQVEDEKAYEEVLKSGDKTYDDHKLRRKVKWLVAYNRMEINPNIWRILHTHQTIVNATELSPWLDPLVYDFFRKGDQFHYQIKIKKKQHINARVLFESCLDLFELGDDWAHKEDESESSRDIDVKINLNSPGGIELIAASAFILGAIALFVVLINGGGAKFSSSKLGANFDVKTEGLIKKLNDFLNDSKNRKLKATLEEKLKDLEVENSEQMIKLIEALRDKKL